MDLVYTVRYLFHFIIRRRSMKDGNYRVVALNQFGSDPGDVRDLDMVFNQ
jgi:hypothetical protein